MNSKSLCLKDLEKPSEVRLARVATTRDKSSRGTHDSDTAPNMREHTATTTLPNIVSTHSVKKSIK
jgi:hypothetical protein